MIPSEIRQLRRFVSSLTAKTRQPWCIAENEHTVGAEIVVRVDPIASTMRTGKLDATEVMRIPAAVSLDEARRLVIEKLGTASDA